jgi:hypothetical protein
MRTLLPPSRPASPTCSRRGAGSGVQPSGAGPCSGTNPVLICQTSPLDCGFRQLDAACGLRGNPGRARHIRRYRRPSRRGMQICVCIRAGSSSYIARAACRSATALEPYAKRGVHLLSERGAAPWFASSRTPSVSAAGGSSERVCRQPRACRCPVCRTRVQGLLILWCLSAANRGCTWREQKMLQVRSVGEDAAYLSSSGVIKLFFPWYLSVGLLQ